ncbi:MAG TPA: FHA domain-containing protein, partial [Thiotrichales bacterium]|nr:FHA domain-containing protein [Thiotrichales bacterium]
MARLVITYQGRKIREIPLTRGTITIGRKAHNTIQLDDRTASAEHAKIVTLFRSSFIQDLCSTNGTLVNGRRIKVHTLHDGDLINIGRHLIRFEAESVAAAVHQAMGTDVDEVAPSLDEPAQSPPRVIDLEEARALARDETRELELEEAAENTAGDLTSAEIGTLSLSSVAGGATSPISVVSGRERRRVVRCYLRVLTGEESGKQLELGKSPLQLGTMPGAGAVIESRPEGHFLCREDGGRHTSYPIRLNDNEIGANSCLLQHRDILEVGGVWMEYCVVTAPP